MSNKVTNHSFFKNKFLVGFTRKSICWGDRVRTWSASDHKGHIPLYLIPTWWFLIVIPLIRNQLTCVLFLFTSSPSLLVSLHHLVFSILFLKPFFWISHKRGIALSGESFEKTSAIFSKKERSIDGSVWPLSVSERGPYIRPAVWHVPLK